MADNKVRMHYASKLQSREVWIERCCTQDKFCHERRHGQKGPHRSAVFGLSPELARGLAKALTTVLDTPTKPPEPKALVH